MRRVEWPNGLGFDLKTSRGEWEVLTPANSSQPFRARYVPRGERYASRYGEGATAEEAVAVAQLVER